jgi:hypothetical protein
MELVAYTILAYLGFNFSISLFLWLTEGKKHPPAKEYTTKTLHSYAADFEQLKALIGKAKTYGQIKALFDVIYSFRLRYRKFKRYGVDVDGNTDELISLIDQRLIDINCYTRKNRILTFFF